MAEECRDIGDRWSPGGIVVGAEGGWEEGGAPPRKEKVVTGSFILFLFGIIKE